MERIIQTTEQIHEISKRVFNPKNEVLIIGISRRTLEGEVKFKVIVYGTNESQKHELMSMISCDPSNISFECECCNANVSFMEYEQGGGVCLKCQGAV